jgi:hypothetical protein
MRILRVRRGFQADHSSSPYLSYAMDHPVSTAGQAIANVAARRDGDSFKRAEESGCTRQARGKAGRLRPVAASS